MDDKTTIRYLKAIKNEMIAFQDRSRADMHYWLEAIDEAIKIIETLSKPSVVSVEEIETLISNMAVECNTKNITPSFIWKCNLEDLAQAIHKLITKGEPK